MFGRMRPGWVLLGRVVAGQGTAGVWRGHVGPGTVRCGLEGYGKERQVTGLPLFFGKKMEIQKFPIDFDALTKGQEFTPVQLREILGKEPGTDAYRFAVMGLQALIHERTGFTAKCLTDGSIRVLTDAEAAEHNPKIFAQNLRSLILRHTLSTQVDVDNLNTEQRRNHDRNLMIQSRYISSIKGVTKQLAAQKPKKVEAATRDTSTPQGGGRPQTKS